MISKCFLAQAALLVSSASAAPPDSNAHEQWRNGITSEYFPASIADIEWPTTNLTEDQEDDIFWHVRQVAQKQAFLAKTFEDGCSGCAHGPEGYVSCQGRVQWLLGTGKSCDDALRITGEDCPGACTECGVNICQRPRPPINPRPAFVDPKQTANGEGWIFAIGDWGNGDPHFTMHWKCIAGMYHGPNCQVGTPEWHRDADAQFNVARVMLERAKQLKPQLFINTGDNIYVEGLESVDDMKMTHVFEDRYPDKEFQVPWLSVLGNHDWGGHACYWDDANWRLARGYYQIDYDTEHDWEWPNHKERRWVLPDTVYKKRINFGKVTMDIFGFDSNFARPEENCGHVGFGTPCEGPRSSACYGFISALQKKTMDFMREELPKSDATWKIVFAHHPIGFFAGRWGDFYDLMGRSKVSLFLAGHSHNLQRLNHGSFVELVTGAGGGAIYDNLPYGFTMLKVSAEKIEYSWVNDRGQDMPWLGGTVWHPSLQTEEEVTV